MKATFATLVGSYRLVMTDDLMSFIERTFIRAAPAEKRDAVRDEVLREAQGAELEIAVQAQGAYVASRSNGVEFYRVPVEPFVDHREELHFEKGTGERVCVVIVDLDTLVTHQAGQPSKHFRRVASGTSG